MGIKDRIIEGTLELMVIDGIKHTTMDSVANHIGASKRTIYEHFEDKKNLIHTCITTLIEQQERDAAEVIAGSSNVMEELFRMFKLINKRIESNGRIALEVKRHYPAIFNTTFKTRYERSYAKMIQTLETGIEQGLILKEANVKFVAYVIMTSVHSLMTSQDKIFTLASISPTESYKYVILYFFRGISTSNGINEIDRLISETKNEQ